MTKQVFSEIFAFKKSGLLRAFVPYRVCPLGAHIDHQHGIVTGFATDKGVEMHYAENGDKIEIISLNFDGKTEFSVGCVPPKNGLWGDYARAAVWALKNAGYTVEKGFCGVIQGELSAGGLSSSAAVILCYLTALCTVNGIRLTCGELITVARSAENGYIGLNCGTLDQSCEVLCRENHLLVLDTQSGKFENIRQPENMPDFEIGIFFSGLTRSLVSSKYNLRTQELSSAVSTLKTLGNIETQNDVLREIPLEIFEHFRSRLPENERLRCEHYYGEMKRVEQGVQAFKNGDTARFGEYITQSGLSSIEKYEAGSKELISLYNILINTTGVFGARFSGAGFKGCCMAIIDPKFKEEIAQTVTQKYCKTFPELSDNFGVHFCKTADGTGQKKNLLG